MNPIWSTVLTAGIPTVAVLIAILRNETALAALSSRVTSLEERLDSRITSLERQLSARIETLEQKFGLRIETLDRDLRDWAKITMAHNTDIARLKDKASLE